MCCEPLLFYSLGSCNHNSVCFRCCFRLRILSKDHRCCICKTELGCVAVLRNDGSSAKLFGSLDVRQMLYDKKWNFYAEDPEVVSYVLELRRLACNVCHEPSPDIVALQHHAEQSHGLRYCTTCSRGSKKFYSELPLYSAEDLKRHQQKGAPPVDPPNFHGHPVCRFCDRMFYADDDLFQHMHQSHENCFVCTRLGVHFRYYRNYEELWKHFERDHHVCTEPQCLEKRFVVFPSDGDLRAHLALEHGHGMRGNKLDIRFFGAAPVSGSGGVVVASSVAPFSSSSVATGSRPDAGKPRRSEAPRPRRPVDVVDLSSLANVSISARSREEIIESLHSYVRKHMPVGAPDMDALLGAGNSTSAPRSATESERTDRVETNERLRRSQEHLSGSSVGAAAVPQPPSLMDRVNTALQGDQNLLRELRESSRLYRDGRIPAADLVRRMRELFGSFYERHLALDIARDLKDAKLRTGLEDAIQQQYAQHHRESNWHMQPSPSPSLQADFGPTLSASVPTHVSAPVVSRMDPAVSESVGQAIRGSADGMGAAYRDAIDASSLVGGQRESWPTLAGGPAPTPGKTSVGRGVWSAAGRLSSGRPGGSFAPAPVAAAPLSLAQRHMTAASIVAGDRVPAAQGSESVGTFLSRHSADVQRAGGNYPALASAATEGSAFSADAQAALEEMRSKGAKLAAKTASAWTSSLPAGGKKQAHRRKNVLGVADLEDLASSARGGPAAIPNAWERSTSATKPL